MEAKFHTKIPTVLKNGVIVHYVLFFTGETEVIYSLEQHAINGKKYLDKFGLHLIRHACISTYIFG